MQQSLFISKNIIQLQQQQRIIFNISSCMNKGILSTNHSNNNNFVQRLQQRKYKSFCCYNNNNNNNNNNINQGIVSSSYYPIVTTTTIRSRSRLFSTTLDTTTTLNETTKIFSSTNTTTHTTDTVTTTPLSSSSSSNIVNATTNTSMHANHNNNINPTKEYNDILEYDIVIIGGGIIGSCLLDQLLIQQQQSSSKLSKSSFLRIAMIETTNGPSNTNHNQNNNTTQQTSIPHPRSYALSPASIQTLFGHTNASHNTTNNNNNANGNNTNTNNVYNNITQYFGEQEQGYYTSMQVWESNQPASLIWTIHDLQRQNHTNNNNKTNTSSNNNTNQSILGWCIEDSKIHEYLWYQRLLYQPKQCTNNIYVNTKNNISIYTSTTLTDLILPDITTATTTDQNNNNPSSWVYGTLTTNTLNNTATDQSQPTNMMTSSSSSSSSKVRFRTRLLIAADGSQSKVRNIANIQMQQYNYQQTALTFTVQYKNTTNSTQQHRRRAYQRYLSNGSILALLPTYDSSKYGIIVWSTNTNEAQYWKQAFSNNNNNNNNNKDVSMDDLIVHLNSMLQTGPELLPSFVQPILNSNNNYQNDDNADSYSVPKQMISNVLYGVEKVIDTIQYGMSTAGQQQQSDNDPDTLFHAPPIIEQIVSKPFTYPLICQIPERNQYTIQSHLALVGDAAHTIHPMAGQGLNLGIQDVIALSSCIMKAKNSGMDIGTYLYEYNTSRQIQVSTTVASIHGLQQLLTNQNVFGKHIKAFGMNCIQNIQPLRQKIVQAACYGI